MGSEETGGPVFCMNVPTTTLDAEDMALVGCDEVMFVPDEIQASFPLQPWCS